MTKYTNAYKQTGCLFDTTPLYTQMPNRSIITNVPDTQVTDNQIKTSKYNLLNFIPLNLLIQFSKLPNIYFLIIGIMQMIRSISVSGGFPVIFIPLGIVIAVSAIKDFYQDMKRKKSDEQINNCKAKVLTDKGFQQTKWKFLRIGDIIKVNQNQPFPADVILLQSSQEKMSCFIETKNLDGETNLKYKKIKYDIGKQMKLLKDQFQNQLHFIRVQFFYERPNPFIYSFTGSQNGIPIDNNNIVLRGCNLKITNWVTGLVIYTGADTKIMLNSNKSRQKKSRLEFKMGIVVVAIFIAQMVLTFISAFISRISADKFSPEFNEIRDHQNLLVNWGSWILLFTNFVPISLIVSLQIVKYIQGYYISKAFYHTDQPAEVKVQTSTLNQELGQIQHVFSDKTGTLTRNYMSFKHMVIGNSCYGNDHVKTPVPLQITNVDFHDQQFFLQLTKNFPDEKNVVYDMLVCLAFCHSVIIQEDQDGNKRYNSSSPDQLAFINMAKYCGWEFTGVNSQNEVCVNTKKGIIKYKMLHIIEFDSDRKRMTVILEKNDRIFVYCKGADNIILKRLKKRNTEIQNLICKNVDEWSQQGLRTLLFAKRQILKNDYQKWAKMYAGSLSKLQKVQKQQKVKLQKQLSKRASSQQRMSINQVAKLIIEDESLPQQLMNETPELIVHRLLNDNSLLSEKQKIFIEKYFDKMAQESSASSKEIEEILEKQFELFGATAIEDQLQDNVKETIRSIKMAGVKAWMLTGDKKETAINIGISCGLIEPDMAIIEWKQTQRQTLHERQKYPQSRDCCLVASGQDLLGQLDETILLQLINSCRSVICCRVTPKQKQDMVWLMRKNRFTTLAVGDGANDVNMINAAHVGIGIKGVEGSQAALCSDYAISEFQILRELMLHHGRQAYRKNSQLILFNFYKNLLLVLPQFWFGFNNYFSSATIYDPWIYQLYNVAFTSMPIVFYSIFDYQFSSSYSIQKPELYQTGLKNKLFNRNKIAIWFLLTAVYALMLELINFHAADKTYNNKGDTLDLLSCGMSIYVQCVIIANLKVLLLSYQKSFILSFLCFLGIFFYFVLAAIAEKFFLFSDFRNVFTNQINSASYWSAVILGVTLITVIQSIIDNYGKLQEQMQLVSVKFEQIEFPLLEKKGRYSIKFDQ